MRSLRQAGELLGITLLDHIILGDDRTYSFADHSWPCA
nr:JAB domain-containing protein [Nitrospira cf. moscoviensis SBR1015]